MIGPCLFSTFNSLFGIGWASPGSFHLDQLNLCRSNPPPEGTVLLPVNPVNGHKKPPSPAATTAPTPTPPTTSATSVTVAAVATPAQTTVVQLPTRAEEPIQVSCLLIKTKVRLGGPDSTEEAFLLYNQQPLVQILSLPIFFFIYC